MGTIRNLYPKNIIVVYDNEWTLKYCLRVVNDSRYDPNHIFYFSRWDLKGLNEWIEAYQPPEDAGDRIVPKSNYPTWWRHQKYLEPKYDYSESKYYITVHNDPRYDPTERIYLYDKQSVNEWCDSYDPPTENGEDGEAKPSGLALFMLILWFLFLIGWLLYDARKRK